MFKTSPPPHPLQQWSTNNFSVPSAENLELSRVPSVKLEVGQTIPFHDSPTARNSVFLIPTFPVYSFIFCLILSQHKVLLTVNQLFVFLCKFILFPCPSSPLHKKHLFFNGEGVVLVYALSSSC